MKPNVQRLKQLLAEALALPAAEHKEFVERSCTGDAELRAELERLIKAHESAGNFLEQSVVPPERDFRILVSGSYVGRYKLLQEIGEGGFGRVFMAEQTEPVRRRVALKIVKAGMDTPEVIARFEAERQALALMDHPNIARVLDAGTTEAGHPYFVMELVKGIPITDYCDRIQLPMSARLQLFMQVCQAVQHAHQKAIIHRDLKPTNILVTMIDGRPVPKIIDFGVAKALGQKLTDKTLFTSFQTMIGTPTYMSPEQAELSGVDIDTRSDIYALGVLLYELLTGVTPFDTETFRTAALDEVRRVIREVEPLKPSTRLRGLGDKLTEVAQRRQVEPSVLPRLIHGDLDWIVMKCLEKDCARRYETANSLVTDIANYLAHRAVLASPPGTVYRARKFICRHRMGVALAASLTATLIGGLVVSLVAFAEARRERDHALAAESLAREQSWLASGNLYRAHIRMAEEDWEAGQLGRMVETLQEHIPKPGQPDRRGWEWYYLWSLCHNARREWGHHPGPVSSLAMHPNGQWLASASGSQIRIWDVNSGRQLARLDGHTRTVNFVAWSPDGTRLASCGWDGRVILWGTNRFRRLREFDCGRYVWEVRWSPDGTQVAASQSGNGPGGDGGVVTIWDATSGEKLHRLAGNVGIIWTLAWQPHGKLLVTGENYNGRIQVWDPVKGELIKTFQAHNHFVTSVAWSPDGRRLASASADQTIRIWTADTWESLLEINPAHNGVVTCLLWSGDGRTLTSGGKDGLLKTWDSHSGTLLHVLRAHSGGVNAICWSRNGDFLISAGGDPVIRCWNPNEDQSARVVAGSGVCAWSPEERYLATGSVLDDDDPAGVLVLDTATWQIRYRLSYPTKGSRGYLSSGDWSADGRKLAVAFASSFVQVWDMTVRKEIWSWQDGNSNLALVRSVDWSPDSRLLAVCTFWESLVRVWEPETGKLLRTFNGHSRPVFSAVWHPDGRWIASKDMGGQLLIWDVTTGEVFRQLACPGGTAGNQGVVSWNPEGTLLAAGCGNGSIRIWDVQSGKLVRELKRHAGSVRSLCWSPDGRRLVSGAEDRTIRLWDTETGQELMSLPHSHVRMPVVSWSPSGRMIAVCSDQVRIYDASIGYKLSSAPASSVPAITIPSDRPTNH